MKRNFTQTLFPSFFAMRFGQLNWGRVICINLKPNLIKMEVKKLINLRRVFTLFMIICATSSFAQMSYEEYKDRYKPHHEKLTPSAKLVTTVNESTDEVGAAVIELLLQKLDANSNDEENKLNLVAILTSCNRDKVAAMLKELTNKQAAQALLWLKDEWIREVVWFVDETTYQNIAPHLSAIYNWKGDTEGPFGPGVKNWAPVYAGIGLDKSWGGYKGVNEYIDAYNGWTTKVNPANGTLVTLTEPLSSMGNTNGVGLFGAFYKKNKGFVEIDYQNRTAKSEGGGAGFEKAFKFSSHTLGVSYLKSKKYEPTFMKFYSGWGLHFQTGGVSERNSFTNPKWEKWGSGFTAGLSYNLGMFINPVKDVPVMIGAKAYAQLNFLNYDVSFMEDTSPQVAWGGTGSEKFKGAHHLYGIQIQAIYKFGGKEKNPKTYRSFEQELADDHDKNLNTSYAEISPRISPDGKTMYFVRTEHPLNQNGALQSQDIWMADVSNGIENAKATHLENPFNQKTNNSVVGITPDENAMMIKGKYKNGVYEGKGYSLVYRTKTGWSNPEGIEIKDYANMAKGTYIGQYWSQDGKNLILSMSESSSDDKQDIYVSQLQEDGTWSRPLNLGETINSSSTDDHSPFLASDGKTLYYSTDREGGQGSNDIWFSKRLDDTWTNWSEPENAGPEVNTDGWDAYYSIDASGKYAYMSSTKNSVGRNDIIRIKLKEEVQPDPVVLVTGKVIDAKTNEPIEATIAYNGLVDGKNYGIARTNPATGEYKIVLPYGVNYDFSANAEGHIGVSENLDLTSVGEYKEIERDLSLVPIEVGSTVRLNNIFFETGSATLKSESYGELNRVVKFLNNNPTIKIELGGHTDNVGSDASNQKLSQQRVNSVMDYLLAQGVDAAKMLAKGYGESKPVDTNDTEEGRQNNRRVEFIILEK